MSLETTAVGLSKRYGRLQPWVLDGVDAGFHRGTLSVVVGANGCGKSTLLRLLAGVSRPNRGVITRPANVSYAPERLPARLQMTGRTYLAHMGRLRALESAYLTERVEQLAHDLALTPGLGVPFGRLSKGNARKVLLAQALLVTDGLLLLDEPFSGLDEVATEGLYHELARATAAGATVIVTAHSGVSVRNADLTLELVGGRVRPLESRRDESIRSGLARITLIAPDDVIGPFTPPDWMRPFRPIMVEQRWCLSVATGPSLDQLLVRSISEGWSVHRVTPPIDPAALGPETLRLTEGQGRPHAPDVDLPGP